jgi:hypothetical protein
MFELFDSRGPTPIVQPFVEDFVGVGNCLGGRVRHARTNPANSASLNATDNAGSASAAQRISAVAAIEGVAAADTIAASDAVRGAESECDLTICI